MSAYLIPIRTAVLTFPFLALIIALPFLIVQYRRFGSFTFSRAFVLYTFVFYMLTAYFMVILPLPAREWVAQLTTQRYQLVPFTAVREFLNTSGFVFSNPHTWLRAIRSASFLQPVFNLLLTLPFGFYLRYYFRRNWRQVLLMSFGLSLFFELTQLSGLYFIYPRPYRLFDVDDLIVNTAGGMIGYYLTPLIRLAFPNRDKMDQRSYQRGQKVGWVRRWLAWFIDYAIYGAFVRFMLILLLHNALGLPNSVVTPLSYLLTIALVFILPSLMGGATLGKRIVRIKVQLLPATTGTWRIPLRFALLYYFCLPVWSWWWQELSHVLTVISARTELNLFIVAILSLLVLFFIANFIWTLWQRDGRLFYDDWARTRQSSTVLPKQKVND
jgi:glycopeptide antibiotics resistance protein/uncharacterized RDD family membrane protein YckC